MATNFELTFDCAHPGALAEFWAAALGYQKEAPPDGFSTWELWLAEQGVPEDEWDTGSSIVDPAGRGTRIYFQQVPEKKSAKNRVHLDVDVSGGRGTPLEDRKEEVEGAAARLVALGARRVRPHEQSDHYHLVMQDPEGNEFCLR